MNGEIVSFSLFLSFPSDDETRDYNDIDDHDRSPQLSVCSANAHVADLYAENILLRVSNIVLFTEVNLYRYVYKRLRSIELTGHELTEHI